MKHLKVSGHQPSKSVSDKRKVFEDYKQCYTCKMDFDGFYNLMNHRKSVHPSNKPCRNFLNGTCAHGSECWYVHGQRVEDNDMLDKFKCNVCEREYKGRDNFMKHRKQQHPDHVPSCEKFRTNRCERNNNECWYEHNNSENRNAENSSWAKIVTNTGSTKPANSGFHEDQSNFPPDQMKMMLEMVRNLYSKMENMEKRFEIPTK